MKNRVFVIIPNWNGADYISACLESLANQSVEAEVVVVDNGSIDNSVSIIEDEFPGANIIKLTKNTGFAGGVNTGIKYAIDKGAEFVLLLNNDAVADRRWVEELIKPLQARPELGIVASKILTMTNPEQIDSTGEFYSTWGLPFPRGRDEIDSNQYDDKASWPIFGGSGGASGYRVSMLKEIGLFDEDFFAYYEDVDISFRAQLAGWQAAFVPAAVVKHHIGGTSSKLKGFATYQTFKNLPLLIIKNVPGKLLFSVIPRFLFAYMVLYTAQVVRLNFLTATKGVLHALILTPKKLSERIKIQKNKKLDSAQLTNKLFKGMPPSYASLYRLVYPFRKGKE